MTLPAFATVDDLTSRMGDVSDPARAQAALDDASAEIRACAGVTFATDDALDFTDYPSWAQQALLKVCCSAAHRALTNPEGVSQESLGSYSVSLANASSDVYLTKSERNLVHRAASKSGYGVFAIDTAPCITDYHAEVCALRFGADYCSCGADITRGFPIYELP